MDSTWPGSGPQMQAQIAFAGNRIDPQSEKRGDDAAEQALAAPGARLMLMREGRLCLKTGQDAFDAYFSPAEAAGLSARMDEAVLLGHTEGGPVLAAPHDHDRESLPEGIKAIDFRSIYIQGLLDAPDLGALAQGAALLAWHETHRYCGRCGGGTTMRAGGYRRSCPRCGREHFPRTDPVVIMLAVRGERCLLGRSPHFAPGMYSCLAGFIEPGETIERAVRRETLEESGVRIGRVRYCASQPWPFPHSLMIGCIAEAESAAVDPDLSELEDCRWFARDEVMRMLAGTHEAGLTVPPEGAIARYLIAGWAHRSATETSGA